MQIVFFGSSDYSIPVLQKLLDRKINVVGVVTTPDKPVGRHLKLTPNPVKLLAQKNNLSIFENLSGTDLLTFLTQACATSTPPVVGLVAAFGRIIPQEILNTFNNQIYNIHPSLLPKYRGPSPLQQQILDGVTETGVTVIQLDAKMDHGPIIAVEKDIILPNDTPVTLGQRLFTKGTDLFINTPLTKGIPQDDSLATFTKKLTRQDGFLFWPDFQKQLTTHNSSLITKYHAFYPWPGVWSINPEGQRVILTSINPLSFRTIP
jgi:methionyl-tRNA formyltransferase